MRATELIKQVAALPPREKMLFERLFNEMRKSTWTPANASRTGWPDFAARLHHIYGDKVVPDSQKIIDEGRGDR